MADENQKKVYLCLNDELSVDEKKDLLIKKDITIKSFQAKRLRNESQWSVMMNLFRSSLGKKIFQNAIIKYYVETILYEDNNSYDKKTATEEKQNLDRETLVNDSKRMGFYKVLVYLAIHAEYEKAVQLIEDVPEDKRFRNGVGLIEQAEQTKLKQLEEDRKKLFEENQILTGKVTKQEEFIKHLEVKHEKRIQQLESDHKTKIKKLEDKHLHFQTHSALEKKELQAQLLLIKKQMNELDSRHMKLESENNDLKQKLEQQNQTMSMRRKLENRTEEVKKQKILIFGNIPREVKSDLFDFEIFSKDAATYPFDEQFDEYWFIDDMASRRLSFELRRNPHRKNINFKRLDYYKMISELRGEKLK